MPTLAMAAFPAMPPRPGSRRLPSSVRLAGLAGVGLVAVGAAWLLGRPSRAPAPAIGAPFDSASGRAASAAPSRPVARRAAPPPPTGRLRLLTTPPDAEIVIEDRKSTRLNSSHDQISYAVFCLKKKKKKNNIVCSA